MQKFMYVYPYFYVLNDNLFALHERSSHMEPRLFRSISISLRGDIRHLFPWDAWEYLFLVPPMFCVPAISL